MTLWPPCILALKSFKSTLQISETAQFLSLLHLLEYLLQVKFQELIFALSWWMAVIVQSIFAAYLWWYRDQFRSHELPRFQSLCFANQSLILWFQCASKIQTQSHGNNKYTSLFLQDSRKRAFALKRWVDSAARWSEYHTWDRETTSYITCMIASVFMITLFLDSNCDSQQQSKSWMGCCNHFRFPWTFCSIVPMY